MFSVKATYFGETRRFNFPDLTFFPTFDQLQNQLLRVFPLNSSCYLSNLLFSPDASHPGSRIKIGQEAHNADDYNKHLAEYRGRSWPNALLKFDLVNEASNWIGSWGSRHFFIQTVGQGPQWGSADTPSHPTPQGLYVPPPPTLSVHPQPPVGTDPVLVDVSYQSPRAHSDLHLVPPHARDHTPAQTLAGPCSETEAKMQIATLLHNLQEDLNHVLARSFASSSTACTPNPSGRTDPSTPLPFQCSSCKAPVVGPWYTCSGCSVLVCSHCCLFGDAGFCPVSVGRHTLRLASSAATPLAHLANHLPVAPEIPLSPPPAPPVVPFIPSALPMQDPTHPIPNRSISPISPIAIVTPPPPPVIHRGVICDICEATIEGVRHKCLDCPDYDLCTPCISSGLSQRHNPSHKFLELSEPTRIIVHTVNTEDDLRGPPAPIVVEPPTPPVQHQATCDLCDSVIQGSRYKCAACPDYDTCSSCFAITGEHHPNHSFIKLSKPDDYITRGNSAPPRHYATCNVCERPIAGVRYKCMDRDCPDFDLCERCEALPIPQHPDNHPMLKMKSVDAVIPTVYRVGQRSMLPASERSPVCSVEDGYMHNPHVPVNDSPRSISPSPEPVCGGSRGSHRKSSLSLETPWLGRKDNTLNLAGSETTRLHEGTTPHDSPQCHRSSVRTISPPAKERPYSPTQWSAAVDYSMYRLPGDPQLHPEFQAQSPTALETVIEPSTELFSEPFPRSLSESLNSLVRPSLEHLVGTVRDQEGATTAHQSAAESIRDSPLGSEALLHRSLISSDSFSIREMIPLAELLEDESQPIRRQEKFPQHHSDEAVFAGDYPSADGPQPQVVSTEAKSANRPTEFNAKWVEDVTCPDGQLFGPQTTFIKVWRMVNTGENTWPKGIELVRVFGDSLETGNSDPNLAPMDTMNSVGPGDQKNIWTGELKTPEKPGRHKVYYRLRSPSGELFGDDLLVDIRVINPWYIDHPEDIANETTALPDPALQARSPAASKDCENSSSSMVVMPDPTLPQAPLPILSTDRIASKPRTSDMENLSDDDALSDSSSLSYVSVPRPSEDEDEDLYAASRTDVLDDFVADFTPSAADYDFPYDSNTSEEE